MEPICHRIRAIAWSSSGRWFAKLDDDGNIDVHESESGAIRWQVPGEDGLFYGFSYRANRMRCWLSNDGDRVLAMNHNGALTEARRSKAEWITNTGTENCYGALAVSEDESVVARAVIIPPRWADEHDSSVAIHTGDGDPIQAPLGRKIELLAMQLRGGTLTVVTSDNAFPATIRIERFASDLSSRETLGTFPAKLLPRVAAFQPNGRVAFLGVRLDAQHQPTTNVVGIATEHAEILWSRDLAPFRKNEFVFSTTNTDLVLDDGRLVVGHEKHYLDSYPARIQVWSIEDASLEPTHELLLPGIDHVSLHPRAQCAILGAVRRSRSALVSLPSGAIQYSLGAQRKPPNLTPAMGGALLATLDQVDWTSFKHAYGSAGDVPDVIRELTLPDAGRREGAWHALYGNIYHQGSIYEATPWAVPFFLELLASDGVQGKADILRYLRALAQACGWARARGEDSSDESGEFAEDVEKGLRAAPQLYTRLLDDGDDETRMHALGLIATLGIDGEPQKIREAFASLSEPRQRAAIALSGDIARHLTIETEPLVRTAIAVARMDAAVVSHALENDPELIQELVSISDDEPIEGIARRLSRSDRFDELVEPLCQFLENAGDDELLESFGCVLVERVIPARVEQLDERQRRVLMLFTNADLPFDVMRALEKAGFEDISSSEDLSRLLGVRPATRAVDASQLVIEAPRPATGSSALSHGELDDGQRAMVAAFVDHLDEHGWKEARQWYDFARRAPELAVDPIAHGRYYASDSVLEVAVFFFDPDIAKETNERTGDPFLRVTIVSRSEGGAIPLRAYVTSENLTSVLEAVTSKQDVITHANFDDELVLPLVALGIPLAIELGPGELARIERAEPGSN